jgi:hypothetical protein
VKPPFPINRRGALLSGASLALALSWRGSRAATRSCAVERQPFFACVDRAIAALANFGEPVAAVDSARLAELAQKGDVGAAAEEIPRHYTLTPGDPGGTFDFDCLPTRDIPLGIRDFDGRAVWLR